MKEQVHLLACLHTHDFWQVPETSAFCGSPPKPQPSQTRLFIPSRACCILKDTQAHNDSFLHTVGSCSPCHKFSHCMRMCSCSHVIPPSLSSPMFPLISV